MVRTEIDAVRELLCSQRRPSGFADRRKRLDSICSAHPSASDISLEAGSVGGVPVEWSLAPGSDPSRALLFFSRRRLLFRLNRAASINGAPQNYKPPVRRRTLKHLQGAARYDAQSCEWVGPPAPAQTKVGIQLAFGKTKSAITLELGIQLTSVVDVTRKLYQNLDIHSSAELATKIWLCQKQGEARQISRRAG